MTREAVQLFLRPGEILLVLEDEVGRRTRERWPARGSRAEEEVRRVARHLARRGDVTGVRRLRARRERGGALRDDAALGTRFRDAFEAERDRP